MRRAEFDGMRKLIFEMGPYLDMSEQDMAGVVREDPGMMLRAFQKAAQQRIIVMKDKLQVLVQGKELLMQERYQIEQKCKELA